MGTRFAAAQQDFVQQAVPLVTSLAQETSTASRTSAATLAGALTPFLSPAQVGLPGSGSLLKHPKSPGAVQEQYRPIPCSSGLCIIHSEHFGSHPGRGPHSFSVPCSGGAKGLERFHPTV